MAHAEVEFHITDRGSGKSMQLLKWLTEAPEGEWRIYVSHSSERAMRMLRHARSLDLEVESWQFVGVEEVRAHTWSGVLAGRGGHVVLGLDDLDLMFYHLFGWPVHRVSATGRLVNDVVDEKLREEIVQKEQPNAALREPSRASSEGMRL